MKKKAKPREGRSVAWWLEALRANLVKLQTRSANGSPNDLAKINARLVEDLEKAVEIAETLDLEIIQTRTKLVMSQKMIIKHQRRIGPRVALLWLRNISQLPGWRRRKR